jgi:hypothetical protein
VLTTEKQMLSDFLDRMALAMVKKTNLDMVIARKLIVAALDEIDVELWDLYKLASKDYTLCDGYCNYYD